MQNKIKLNLLLFFCFLFGTILLLPQFASAEYYTTDKYKVDIIIHEDRTFEIKENIDVTFTEKRHGIFRYIPKKTTFLMDYGDGDVKEIAYTALIRNAGVENHPYSFVSNKDDYFFQIGDKDVYVDGKQNYQLSYDYKYADDGFDQYDLVYHNVLPHEWPSDIKDIEITVQMPKRFNTKHAEVTSGRYGKRNHAKLEYIFEENTIHIKNTEPFERFEGVTIFIPLAPGYFIHEPEFSPYVLFIMIVAGLLTLVGLILWFTKLKVAKMPEPVSFYPPHNFNPAELSFYLNGRISRNDFASLLVYYAYKGNIDLVVFEGHYTVVKKLKDLDENAKEHEKVFFANLFKESNEFRVSERPVEFYEILQTSLKVLKNELCNKKYVLPNKELLIAFFALITALPSALLGFGDYNPFDVAVNYALVALPPLFIFFFVKVFRITDKLRIGNIVFISVFVLPVLAIYAAAVVIVSNNLYHNEYLGYFIFICAIINIIIGSSKFGRTQEGEKLYGEIMGFRNFIEIAEADKLQALVDENPEYFYDILPYAYVFGLSTAWIDKLNLVQIPEREDFSERYSRNEIRNNYRSAHAMSSILGTVSSIDGLINTTRSALAQERSASRSSSRRGGSRGGGGGRSSSGGGGGGGGGGSW